MISRHPQVPVSVIIPCYRCADTLARAIDSVAQQTALPKQVILVDDGSADGGVTREIARRLQERYAGQLAMEVAEMSENRGAAEARNAGWALATQPYVAFLDADDAWHPRKLEIQHAYLSQHADVVLCGHGHRQLSDGGAIDWAVESCESARVGCAAMLLSNRFITPSVMLRADIPYRFMPGRRYMEDHLLWSQIICDGLRADRLDVELAAIYKRPYGESGLSAQLWQMARADIGNYLLLHSQGRLGSIAMFAWMGIAIAKFARRLVLHALMRPNKSVRSGGGH